MKTYTRLQKIIEVIGIVITIVYIIYFIVSFGNLPDKTPAHYDFAGEVTRYGSKYEMLIMPILGVLMYGGITILQKYPKAWNVPIKVKPENEVEIYTILRTLIILTKVQMIGIFALISYYSSNMKSIPTYMSVLFIVVPIITIIIGLIKVYGIERKGIIK